MIEDAKEAIEDAKDAAEDAVDEAKEKVAEAVAPVRPTPAQLAQAKLTQSPPRKPSFFGR